MWSHGYGSSNSTRLQLIAECTSSGSILLTFCPLLDHLFKLLLLASDFHCMAVRCVGRKLNVITHNYRFISNLSTENKIVTLEAVDMYTGNRSSSTVQLCCTTMFYGSPDWTNQIFSVFLVAWICTGRTNNMNVCLLELHNLYLLWEVRGTKLTHIITYCTEYLAQTIKKVNRFGSGERRKRGYKSLRTNICHTIAVSFLWSRSISLKATVDSPACFERLGHSVGCNPPRSNTRSFEKYEKNTFTSEDILFWYFSKL